QAGTAPTVSDGVSCTDDSCDEVNDVIVNAVKDANCDNGAFCDGSETCDAVNDCQDGSDPVANDGVSCTDDSCDEVNDVIVHAANDASCDDALFCNGAETCDASLDCQAGTPPTTSDGLACTVDSCDETLDVVVNTADDNLCDDGNPCTAGICDSETGCANVPVEGCVVSVPSADWGGRLLMVLLIGAAALRELAYARRSARTRGR
ncbi:MAG: hypothetical protein HRU01_10980, partial [Myxococcales bacterium]|nr:hypothetical protein [Myxococcales bacterium]